MTTAGQKQGHSSSRREFLKNSAAAVVSGAIGSRLESECRGYAAEINPSIGQPKESIILEVAAGKCNRQNCAVVFDLPVPWRQQQAFTMTRVDTGQPVEVQIEPGDKPRLVWLILDELKAGDSCQYRLAPAAAAFPDYHSIVVSDDGKGLLVASASLPVLRYNFGVVAPPDPKQVEYRRSGFMHPLFNPWGQIVTDDFPPDHMHQHGVWFAWSATSFEGRAVDFWEQGHRSESAAGTGRIEHVKFEEKGGGGVMGYFTALLRHVDLEAPGGPKTVLNETWKVRVYNRIEGFIFDLESTQQCATQSPLTVQKLSYGGIAVRGNRNWFNTKNSEYVTSEGKTRENGNETRPRWVDLYGWIEGRLSGIAILDHPDNFRFPQPVRLHPEKPYFCFAPNGLGDFDINPGNPYVSRYRFYIHSGHPVPEEIDRLWDDFANPAQAQIVQGLGLGTAG